MKSSRLQILLHAIGIGKHDIAVKGDGTVLTDVVRMSNRNYVILYVDTSMAAAQTFHIIITLSGSRKVVADIPYTLYERTSIQPATFDSHDVLYLLMPDRFADGTPDTAQKKTMYSTMREKRWTGEGNTTGVTRHGGDIAGMRRMLDYFSFLGVTVLWPTCMLENNNPRCSYHGYCITDFYHIDPRLGTNEEYRDFIAEANRRGLKVIMDMVFNHCSTYHYLYKDRIDSSWFHPDTRLTNYKPQVATDPYSAEVERRQFTDGWFVPSMPDFAGENPHVSAYLTQTSIWWIEYAGINGIRQDTYPYNDADQMNRWCMDIEREYPGFNIVGETWVNHNVGVAAWQKGRGLAQLPTVMDFPLSSVLCTFFDEQTTDWDGLGRLHFYLTQDSVYADPGHLLTFLSNHDINRFAVTREQTYTLDRYRQALTLLLTLRGIPQLYYGDELAFFARKNDNDSTQRQNFPGGFSDKLNVMTGEGLTAIQKSTLSFTRKILLWRRLPQVNEVIATGRLIHYIPQNGVYVYARIGTSHAVTIFMNGTDSVQQLSLNHYSEVLPSFDGHNAESQWPFDVLSQCVHPLTGTLHFAPRQIYIFEWNRCQ